MTTRPKLSDRVKAERKSCWDYRVVRYHSTDDESFELIEAYYDDEGALYAWCKATPGGNSVNELYDDLARMTEAVGRAQLRSLAFAPIDYEQLPGVGEGTTT
jgi:hypothetical protein